MSKLILEHPKKSIIDAVLMQHLSSRAKAKLLSEKYGINISHTVLNKYHTQYLAGAVEILDTDADADADAGADAGALVPLGIDSTQIAELADALNKQRNITNSLLDKEFNELLALQILITKDALKKHIEGKNRYPTEYIKNLNTIKGLFK